MTILRIIVVETDYGVAANIGGPVQVSRRTFDIPCPADFTAYLTGLSPDERKWATRFIEGIEFREETPCSPSAESSAER